MRCPKCESEEKIKKGKIKNKPRYMCKSCGCQYTRSDKRGFSKEDKRLVMQMYVEGLGLRSIGRVLKVSNIAVYKWINNATEIIKIINLRK